jgi:hypothetical protein
VLDKRDEQKTLKNLVMNGISVKERKALEPELQTYPWMPLPSSEEIPTPLT